MTHIHTKGNMFREGMFRGGLSHGFLENVKLLTAALSRGLHFHLTQHAQKGARPPCKLCLTITGSPAGEESGGQPQRLSKKNASTTRTAFPLTPMRVSSVARNQGAGFRHSSAGSTVIPNPSRIPAILARRLTRILYA
jgi:hypothetical protein